VPRTNLEDALDLLVADVIHKRFSALPADTTIGEVREWFAASSHRRLAVIADARRYVGALTREDLAADVDASRRAAELARHDPTVAPDASARTGHELALTTDARRVPVVDHEGMLIGVVGVTDDLAGFCGTS
jgi:CBS-domain-containing membrane protein